MFFTWSKGGGKYQGYLKSLKAAEGEIMRNVNREDMNRLHNSEGVLDLYTGIVLRSTGASNTGDV